MLNLWKNRIRPADSINCIYISDGKEQLLVDSAIYDEKCNHERIRGGIRCDKVNEVSRLSKVNSNLEKLIKQRYR